MGALFSVLADGTPMRNMLVHGVAATPDGRSVGVTVVYWADASHLFGLLHSLAAAFVAFGAVAGLLAAWVASGRLAGRSSPFTRPPP